MRIGVVGFGVAGATAAALLAEAGHDVTLFEREPERRPAGAGVLLQPSGLLVLERLGVEERIRATAARIDELVAFSATGRMISRMRYADLRPGLHALGVHRTDLMEALADRVARTGARIEHGVEITGAHDPRLRGLDVVVAADGSRSALRRSSGLMRFEHEYAWGALWAIGRADGVPGRLHQVVDGTRRLVGVLPLGGGRANLFWSVRADRVERLRAGGFDAWRDRMSSLCPEAAAPLSTLRGWEDTRFTTYRHAVLRRSHADRLILIGDAAHPMSPHLGQGINLALVDAWRLAQAFAGTRSAAGAFERYAASRRRQIRYYAAVTFALTPFFQSDGVVKGLGRDAVLPLLPRIPLVRRRMLRTLAGMVALDEL